jgi:hypothetical protein
MAGRRCWRILARLITEAAALSASLREPSARLAAAQALIFSAVAGFDEVAPRPGMNRVRALLSTLSLTASL